MKFKRNYDKIQAGGFRRRSILLVFVVVGMVLFLVLLETQFKFHKHSGPQVLNIKFLHKNAYVVEADTTNYEEFASVLRKEIKLYKTSTRPIEIWINFPKNTKAREVADILMIANAFEGVKMRLVSKK